MRPSGLRWSGEGHADLTRAGSTVALWLIAIAAAGPARADEPPAPQPVIAKDSVRVTATRVAGVWKNGKQAPGASWLPEIDFRINGPIAGDNRYSVDVTLPGNKPWTTFDCPNVVGDVRADAFWMMACGATPEGRDDSVKESKAITATGTFGFTIRVRNEAAGTKATLFSGKFKVGKGGAGPKASAEMQYYVDDDWRIPIAYLGFETSPTKRTAGAAYDGNDSNVLLAAMEFRGAPGEIKGQLFHKGNELTQVVCAAGEDSAFDPSKRVWQEQECKFTGVYLNEPTGGGDAPLHAISKNPGDYEIKVTAGGRPARAIKFTVSADGKIDAGISAANHLGSGRAIVPVQVLGNQGPGDKTAWKAGAFYGNPLTGFKPAP
jgi:hypothetical protein